MSHKWKGPAVRTCGASTEPVRQNTVSVKMLTSPEATRKPHIAALPLEKTNYSQYKWLIESGASQAFLPKLDPPICRGSINERGLFEPHSAGNEFLVFETRYDLVFWQPRTGHFASLSGYAFALGDLALDASAELDHLYIHKDPLHWLRHGGEGIVVLDWRRLAFHVSGISCLCVSQDLIAAVQAALTLGMPQIVPVVDGEIR